MCLPFITQEHPQEEEEVENDDTIHHHSSEHHQLCNTNLPLNSLDVMLQQEANVYRSQCLEQLDEDDHLMDWCLQMAQFCVRVADCGGLPTHCVEVAMNLLDRFLFGDTNVKLDGSDNDVSITRQEITSCSSQFQLATLTCLYIATKLSSTKCLTLVQLQSMSSHSADDFRSMELQILFCLQFQINPPTIAAFAQQYIQEELDLDSDDDTNSLILHLVQAQARLATSQLFSFHVPVSSIALACVKNALDVLQEHAFNTLPTHPSKWNQLEHKVRSHYRDDQRDIAVVQEEVQSRLQPAAIQAMEQWNQTNKAAIKSSTWLSTSPTAAVGISKASSSPTTVVSAS